MEERTGWQRVKDWFEWCLVGEVLGLVVILVVVVYRIGRGAVRVLVAAARPSRPG